MAQKKSEEVKETPRVCVCGAEPCIVKCKSRYMVSCRRQHTCAMRSRWASTEQGAIKDWNTTIENERHKRR